MNGLNRTRQVLGGHGAVAQVARACGVTQQAARKWFVDGLLPATELTEVCGKRQTRYGEIIEQLTGGQITDADLRAENQRVRESRKSATQTNKAA